VDPLGTLLLAINQIREPRLFCTERGYQGRLAAEFDRLLDAYPDKITRPIVEEEYQKRADRHGIRLRPDIIVHIPFDRGVSPTRRYDNYLVILLKLSATRTEAHEDFAKLEKICHVLNYPIGAFVNVASEDLWLPDYKRRTCGTFSLREIAVHLDHGEPSALTAAA
jgi:hypothetical protein